MLNDCTGKKIHSKPKSCIHCHLLCRKPVQNWWSPNQIKFCWAQVIFLLGNYDYLNAGHWPVKQNDYFDTHEDVETSLPQSATWEAVSFVKALFDIRIAKLPHSLQHDGKGVLFSINWWQEWTSLDDDAKDIVNYLKGYNPKDQDFTQWKSGRNRDYKSH